MARCMIKTRADLGPTLVLAPERYDPRRESLASRPTGHGIPLAELAASARNTVNPLRNGIERCLILDTSDTREGIVIARKEPVRGSEIGSAKKVVEPNNVIISRLRPYLRQVAYVDSGMHNWASDMAIVCSTEFYVLRSLDDRSIAFLVPFLLSRPVQGVLAASQEGGHHPRFDESTLLTLPVSRELVEQRDTVSRTIEKSINLYRASERGIAEMIDAGWGTHPLRG